MRKKHPLPFKIVRVFSVFVCTFAKAIVYKGRLAILKGREKG